MKLSFATIMFLLCVYSSFSQIADTVISENKKAGFNFGVLPVIGYNSDVGLQYGLVFNIFNYGDGTLYPEYKYTIYTEVSRTTKGGGVNQLFFDSEHLIPGGIRVTADLSYLTELALNYYGYNGYEAVYNSDFEDSNSPFYKSRMFYRHQRKFLRFTADLQGEINASNLLWFGGIGYFDLDIATVDIDKLNKGKSEADQLPETPLLYDQYVDWGIISNLEKEGGIIPSLKAGIIYDSRDNEPNPMKGIWTEAILFYVPEILGNSHFNYTKIAITHRQYFTLSKQTLGLAYRLGYQGTLSGSAPFFMQPYMISSYAKVTTTDGLGGAKTLRGILRNRIVGDGIAYGNIELRWKFLRTVIWNQNIYLALNAFTDAGQVLKEIPLPEDLDQQIPDYENYFSGEKESLHVAYGAGFRFALNQNFIIALDYGIAVDSRDGRDGFYAGIGYLF